MSGKGANPQEKIPCPKCGKGVQRRYLRKHDRSMHQGVRRRRHVCPYCSAEKYKTYSTFQDWNNHLHATHEQCLEYDDPLEQEEYAAGFKLNRWEWFHEIEGAYLRIATLRKHFGRYQGQEEGEPPGPPSTLRLPHTKGTTPDRDATPTESERAGSEQGGSGQEEGEITQTEGDEHGSFTQMRSKDSDLGSDDTTTGQESWRSARDKETVVLTTPRPPPSVARSWRLTPGSRPPKGRRKDSGVTATRLPDSIFLTRQMMIPLGLPGACSAVPHSPVSGNVSSTRGKRRPDRGGGIAKRMESSSSERRDESEDSRSGGTQDRPGRGGRRAAGPSTPPHRPLPPSISPRRSPRLTKGPYPLGQFAVGRLQ